MGIGGTAKKLQKVAEMGEELYKRINDLRTQVAEMKETVAETHERVDRLENEVSEQRAILEALADQEGIDVDALVAKTHISEAETERDAGSADDGSANDRSANDGSANDRSADDRSSDER